MRLSIIKRLRNMERYAAFVFYMRYISILAFCDEVLDLDVLTGGYCSIVSEHY